MAPISLIVAALIVGLPLVGEAQVFRRGEQFASLSFGGGTTRVTPKDFSWSDEKFPDGLRLPNSDRGAPTIEFSVGVMTTERLAIVGNLLEVTGASVSDVPGRIWNLHFRAGIKNWVARRVWLEGAIGPAYTSVAIGEGGDQVDSGKWGWGVVGALGYDLIQRRDVAAMAGGRSHFTLPVQVRVVTNRTGRVRTHSVGLLTGIAVGY